MQDLTLRRNGARFGVDQVAEAATGDLVCFPEGPDGAHAVRNDSAATARFAMPSVDEPTNAAIYPDTQTFVLQGPGGAGHLPRVLIPELLEAELSNGLSEWSLLKGG